MRWKMTYPRLSVLLRRRSPAARHSSHSRSGPLIEEQTLPFYNQKRYYPVRIGDTLKDRYQILAKLGYGGYSTVWLAWDERFEHECISGSID
ncbi:uncharacterized protein LDX57_007098 [Aspergillus melleus]|uniref:uncharacterized protein n=1 Tax=Aspergillus melleus TaxID=138277 RepID=UPI001E8D4DB3|nr:uncharacterized protein LDX57_007098 [Aspergillus melleus]KAH8429435.1 hypothetical protein LDX57_007098 [Aspergillus melleus]